MQTALTSPFVRFMSGNFVTIYDYSTDIGQIYNTVGGERYNVGFHHFVALDKNVCFNANNKLFDLRTGQSTDVNCSFSTNNVRVDEGVVMLSDFWDDYVYYSGIVSLDVSGNCSLLYDGEFYPASYTGGSLFASNNHYIVRELTQISVVKKEESTKKRILIGYNVISVSVAGDKVYFIAEDNFGNKKTGFYSLTTEETIFVITQEEFDEIYTF